MLWVAKNITSISGEKSGGRVQKYVLLLHASYLSTFWVKSYFALWSKNNHSFQLFSVSITVLLTIKQLTTYNSQIWQHFSMNVCNSFPHSTIQNLYLFLYFGDIAYITYFVVYFFVLCSELKMFIYAEKQGSGILN